MAEKRAIVLERQGAHYILLTREGEFIRARLPRDAAVGEEVDLLDGAQPQGSRNRLRLSAFKRWGLAGVAAAVIMALIFTLNWNLLFYSQAVAAVSLDINPRLELTLNKKSTILDVLPINPEAETLVKDLKLKGEPLNTGLREIIQAAKEQNYLSEEQDWVVVGLSPIENNTPLPATLTLEAIEQTIIEETQNLGITGKVTTIPVSSEERGQALTEGLTSAEYGLYQSAKRAGLEISPEAVKDKVQRRQLLENEDVQDQIRNKIADFLLSFYTQALNDSKDEANKDKVATGKGKKDKENKDNNQNNYKGNSKGYKDKTTNTSDKHGELSKQRAKTGADTLKRDQQSAEQKNKESSGSEKKNASEESQLVKRDELRDYLRETKSRLDSYFEQKGNTTYTKQKQGQSSAINKDQDESKSNRGWQNNGYPYPQNSINSWLRWFDR